MNDIFSKSFIKNNECYSLKDSVLFLGGCCNTLRVHVAYYAEIFVSILAIELTYSKAGRSL